MLVAKDLIVRVCCASGEAAEEDRLQGGQVGSGALAFHWRTAQNKGLFFNHCPVIVCVCVCVCICLHN